MKKPDREICIVLPDIRSVYNVGAIFRTAEASGVKKIFLTGLTPTPKDRFNNFRNDFGKTALGSEKAVDWEYTKSPIRVIKNLKREGFLIVSVEQNTRSIDYRNLKLKNKTVFVFGNETLGLPKKITDLSDIVCELPMVGKKESLNVSVCAGIILYNTVFNS